MSRIKISTNEPKIGTLKIAFATSDMKNIDSHFGSTKQFAVYDVSKSSVQTCEIIKIEQKDTTQTLKLLEDVDMVYFTNIGAVAAAKMINLGIFPIKYTQIVSIDEELEKLKVMLNTNPPAFIKKIIEKKAA